MATGRGRISLPLIYCLSRKLELTRRADWKAPESLLSLLTPALALAVHATTTDLHSCWGHEPQVSRPVRQALYCGTVP